MRPGLSAPCVRPCTPTQGARTHVAQEFVLGGLEHHLKHRKHGGGKVAWRHTKKGLEHHLKHRKHGGGKVAEANKKQKNKNRNIVENPLRSSAHPGWNR